MLAGLHVECVEKAAEIGDIEEAVYLKGHEAWARGELTPFLPGQPVHRLTLTPSP